MEYLPVVLLLLAGLAVGGGALLVSALLGPKAPHPMKDQPFECGVPTSGNAQQRISVRFYLVAILFLLFDVETVFFYPWAVVFKDFLSAGPFIIYEMVAFVGVLLAGYLYIYFKGALEWE